jgi:predicted outer membrane protein
VDAGQANYAAVQYAAWTKDHTGNADVRAYAEKVLDQRTLLADRLRALSTRLSVTFANWPDTKAEDEYRHLQSLNPVALDIEFVRDMLKLGQREIGIYQHESANGSDAEVKQWASASLAPLDQLERTAEQTQKSFMTDAKTTSGGAAASPAAHANQE